MATLLSLLLRFVDHRMNVTAMVAIIILNQLDTSSNGIHALRDPQALLEPWSHNIKRVARDLWQHKQTLSSDFALGLGSFTVINPCPPCHNYYIIFIVHCVISWYIILYSFIVVILCLFYLSQKVC